jgi:hypothetical protein
VQFNAVNRAHDFALRLIVVADALRAGLGVDDINGLAHKNGIIWTLRFADVTIDAFFGDQ